MVCLNYKFSLSALNVIIKCSLDKQLRGSIILVKQLRGSIILSHCIRVILTHLLGYPCLSSLLVLRRAEIKHIWVAYIHDSPSLMTVLYLLFGSTIAWQWPKTASCCVLCTGWLLSNFPYPWEGNSQGQEQNRDLLQCSSVFQNVPPAPVREVEMEKALPFRTCKKNAMVASGLFPFSLPQELQKKVARSGRRLATGIASTGYKRSWKLGAQT